MEVTTTISAITVIIVIQTTVSAEEELYFSNGWRPITKEKVLENLHRSFINIPNREYSTYSWNPIVLNEENNVYYERNTDLSPADINRELMNKNDDIITEKIRYQKDGMEEQLNILGQFETHGIDKSSNTGTRKAKKMVENIENENFYNNHEEDVVKSHVKINEEEKELQGIKEKLNNYEVVEATETSQVKDLIATNQQNELTKPYFKPKLETTSMKNLSNILFSILGNYNIRVNDDLTNYALSRSNLNMNSPKSGYVYSAPNGIVPMRNSQNHLPVDPLLAVLLSNYGYYLPGFYGFPGKYNNIYGYLASNNIHNNQPFGAYKIFSDTDSSQ